MRLIFVYNADAGLLNGMLDSVHKIVSPASYDCALCAITYGAFSMHRAWRDYLRSLPCEAVFYHRRDFADAFPELDIKLPAILEENGNVMTPLLSADDLNALHDINALVAALDGALAQRNIG